MVDFVIRPNFNSFPLLVEGLKEKRTEEEKRGTEKKLEKKEKKREKEKKLKKNEWTASLLFLCRQRSIFICICNLYCI